MSETTATETEQVTEQKRRRGRPPKNQQDASPQSEPATPTVPRVEITAGPCPKSDNHTSTRIYKTAGRVRYCVCDECGENWKKSGPYAEEWREYATTLATSLDHTQRREVDGVSVLVMPDSAAVDIASTLRRLASD